MLYYVYILECIDATYYTGVTNNLERRIAEHKEGKDVRAYTYRRRPVKLVYHESHSTPHLAIRREKQIKGWTRRKKEALIQKEFEKLPQLSKTKEQ